MSAREKEARKEGDSEPVEVTLRIFPRTDYEWSDEPWWVRAWVYAAIAVALLNIALGFVF